MQKQARRTGLPLFVTGEALWFTSAGWPRRLSTRRRRPQDTDAVDLMNAIHDYHPAQMAGHHSDKPNKLSRL